jgi:hypothetical protein
VVDATPNGKSSRWAYETGRQEVFGESLTVVVF